MKNFQGFQDQYHLTMSKVTLSKSTIGAVSRTVYSEFQSRFDQNNEKLSNMGVDIAELKEIMLPSIEEFSKLFKLGKSKTEKDPNKPKKPQSAYMFFLNENRKKIIINFENDGIILEGKDRVTKVVKKAGELWNSMDSDDREPFVEKATLAKEVYEKQMAKYTPDIKSVSTKGKIDYASLPIDDAPEGWSGPYDNEFLWGYAAKKKFGIGKFKTFDEAVKAAKAIIDEGNECAGITRDKTGYTLRQTDTRCPSKPGEHNVSWIFNNGDSVEVSKVSNTKKKLITKKSSVNQKKKVKFQLKKKVEPEPEPEDDSSDEEEEENEISVVPQIINGVEYLYDESSNDIYDKSTNELIGKYEDGELKLN